MSDPRKDEPRQGELREWLDSPTDEGRISVMWSRIEARRRRRLAPMVGAAAIALAAAAIGLAWLAREPGAPAPSATAVRPAAELRTADGATIDVLEADAPRDVELDDGSSISLAAGTRIEAIENRDDRFSVLLARGAARFSVRPHGPRRWTVESGLATVEVVGTVFRVERGPAGVRVDVERGVVLVRGERVRDRVVRLTRGQSLVVEEGAGPAAALAAAPAEPAPPRSPRRERPSRAHPPPERAAPPRGRVVVSAPRADDDADGLMLRAEEAGRRGDARAQAQFLRRVSALEDDPRAALAAFTLGRLEMDRLRRPTQARAALRRALALGLPARLAEQARARLATLDSRSPFDGE